MAGSIKWVEYTADTGVKYAVKLDESVSESCFFDDYTELSSLATIPKGLKMRYVNLVRLEAGATLRRTAPIGKFANWTDYASGGSITIDGVVWQVSSLRGEERRIPVSFDTGKNDGDIT